MKSKTQRLTDQLVLEQISKKYKNIKILSGAHQLKIVKKFPLAITLFDNPSNDALVVAASNDVEVLEHFKRIPEDVQIEIMMRRAGDTIKHIPNPTPFVKLLDKVLNTDDPLTAHERLMFLEKALKKKQKFPFLFRMAQSEGWT
jgi:histidinol phosphatase-like PHP family hydrolase